MILELARYYMEQWTDGLFTGLLKVRSTIFAMHTLSLTVRYKVDSLPQERPLSPNLRTSRE